MVLKSLVLIVNALKEHVGSSVLCAFYLYNIAGLKNVQQKFIQFEFDRGEW